MQGKLLIDPSAINLFTKNSEIVLRNTKFNLGELSDTQKLLRGEYFDVITAVGEPQTEFTVIKENELLLKQPDTLVLTLTSPETYHISEGQQIYYNNFAIGEIVSQRIEQDNVHFKIAIAGKYRHLIHPDTLFIAASNFEVSVGVDGIKMQAATPEKWLQGGIRIVAGHQAGKLPQRSRCIAI